MAGVIEIVDDLQLARRANEALRKKYGWMRRGLDLLLWLRRGHWIYLCVRPAHQLGVARSRTAMSDITHRTIHVNDIDMHVAEAGQGPAVLFLHGFPDVWYAWRSQLPALAAAGYHTIAPDLRGCGQSEAPRSIEKYSMRTMTADVVGLLDAMGEHSAVLVAHDMGAHVGWTAAQRFPDRVRAIVALSSPFMPRSPTPPIQRLRDAARDRFHFVAYVQEPGKAEAELEVDVRRSLRLFVHALSGDAPPELVHHLFMERSSTSGCLDGMPEPHRMPNWFTEDDLVYCAREFERTGFAGALNPYRNFDRDWIELAELADVKVHQPALYMAGELDSVTRLGSLDPMRKWVPNLREIVILSACGHWIQQERPEPVSQQLIAFLKNLPVEDPSSAS